MRTLRIILVGLVDAFSDPKVRALLVLTVSMIFVFATLFWLIERWTYLDALFFAVVTISTVGYGDIYPQTIPGRIICMIYILAGLGLFVAAASSVADAMIRRNTGERKEEE